MTAEDLLNAYRDEMAPTLGRAFIEGFIARNRNSMLRMLAPLVALMNERMQAPRVSTPRREEDPDEVTPEKDAIVWAAFRSLVNEKRRAFGMQELDEVTESMPFGGRSVGRIRDRGWGSEVAADKLTARRREMASTRHNAQMTGDHAAWSRRVSAKVGAVLAARKRGSKEAGLAAEASLARELGGKEHIPLAIETYRWEQEQEQRRIGRNEDVESLPAKLSAVEERLVGELVTMGMPRRDARSAVVQTRQHNVEKRLARMSPEEREEEHTRNAEMFQRVFGRNDESLPAKLSAVEERLVGELVTMGMPRRDARSAVVQTRQHNVEKRLARMSPEEREEEHTRNAEMFQRVFGRNDESLPSRTPIAITLRHPKRHDLTAMVTASASEPGRFQLTWVDSEEPSGHTTRDTPEEAVRYAIDEGYRFDSANTAEAKEMVERVQQAREERVAEIDSWLTESLPRRRACSTRSIRDAEDRGRNAVYDANIADAGLTAAWRGMTESLPSPKHAGRMGDGFKVGEHVIRIGDMIKMEGQLGGYVENVDRSKGIARIEQDNGEIKTWPLASLLHDTKENRERQQEHNDKINAEAEARLELSLADWRAR